MLSGTGRLFAVFLLAKRVAGLLLFFHYRHLLRFGLGHWLFLRIQFPEIRPAFVADKVLNVFLFCRSFNMLLNRECY